MLTTLVFAVLSLAGTVSYLSLFVSWHVLPTGYDPIRHAVDDYAVGRCATTLRIGLWASSVGVLALAIGLWVNVKSPSITGKGLVFLFLEPVSRVAMTLFLTDLEGRRRTRKGLLHYLFAIAAFTFTHLAISGATSTLRALGSATWVDQCLRWLAAAVGPELILVVATMLRPLRRVFGLFERLFLLTTNAWFLVVAALLIARSGRRGGSGRGWG